MPAVTGFSTAALKLSFFSRPQVFNSIHSPYNRNNNLLYNKLSMHVERLDLLTFRNYESLTLCLSDGLSVLFGANAQGKSGVLEALYMLATSKSHRTWRDVDVIRVEDEAARIAAQVKRSASPDVQLEIIVSRQAKKTAKINSVKHTRMADLIGELKAVIFSALDIEMIRGEPDLRRRFLNLEISQMSPQYVFALARYKRALEQRNILLRDLKGQYGSYDELPAWNAQVADYGAAVIARRQEFCASLSERAADIYSFLTDSAEKLDISYRPSLKCSTASEQDVKEAFALELGRRQEADIARGTTSVGPHRDDIDFAISGLSARDYASQGQQRTAAIAVKLAEVDLLGNSAGENPVVLLDDAGAELDELRRHRVVQKVAGKCQTIITTTRPDELGEELLRMAAMLEVKAGKVTRA
jgi:DNA replication and repair protein RecF